jgi:hypothetical protein
MSDQYLYGPMGQVLGRITTRNDGALVLYNATGTQLGYYVPAVDTTYDASGRVVGRGNLLGTLLR